MRFDQLSQWLEWLQQLNPDRIELGLQRVSSVWQNLAPGKPGATVVTVAGTNGKGSTVATLEALLCAKQTRVGCYTSPHLLAFNERIRLDGKSIDDQALIQAFDAVDRAAQATPLTYFEFTTLAALYAFAQAGVEVAILEVGLGGRLDAVNIIDADIAVITQVALDHQDWLGDDLGGIALEKAGILRPGIPVVLAEPEPQQALLDRSAELNAKVLRRDKDYQFSNGACWQGNDSSGNPLVFKDLPESPLPEQSVAAAIQVAALLGLNTSDDSLLRQVLSTLRLAGRFQTLAYKGIEVVLDVAHNPAAASLLAQRLERYPVTGKTLALFSVMADKEIKAICEPLLSHFTAWFVADLPNFPRAEAGRNLAQSLYEQGVHMISASKNPRQALARAMTMLVPGDRIVVFGSFITVAEVLEKIGPKAVACAPGQRLEQDAEPATDQATTQPPSR